MDFRTCIKRNGNVTEVKDAVSLRYYISRAIKDNGSGAILFHDADGKKVCANLYADRDFVAGCLGITPDELLPLVSRAIKEPTSPRIVPDAPFLSNLIEVPDLGRLPIPFFYPGDGGPYVTASVFSARAEGRNNISYHRVMVTGRERGTVRLVERDLHRLYVSARNEGQELPVAISIGVPLEVAISGAISVESDVDEYFIANSLSESGGNGPLDLYEMPNGCFVPASTEYVLLGRLTGRTGEEGPFVDITGTRDRIREQPELIIDIIYHRDDPIFHSILPAWHEHFLLMGMPREARIYEMLRAEGIDVKGVCLTPGGCSWLHGAVSIEKRHEDEGIRAGEIAMRAHPSMKHVVIVDSDVDIYSPGELEWAVATRFQADRDMKLFSGLKGSSLDPSSVDGLTSKVIFDATRPLGHVNEYQKVDV